MCFLSSKQLCSLDAQGIASLLMTRLPCYLLSKDPSSLQDMGSTAVCSFMSILALMTREIKVFDQNLSFEIEFNYRTHRLYEVCYKIEVPQEAPICYVLESPSSA